MKKILEKILAAAAITVVSTASVSAQTNLGAECGCPAIGSRPTVNLTTLTDANGNILANSTVLTCDKKWIINDKIFVGSGKTLTIMPGTALFATSTAGANADALIISRGAKIFAAGTETCPIVFTAVADPMDGTFSAGTQQQWGGLVLLGKATNNLLSNTCNGAQANAYIANGLGLIEGFVSADPRAYYGADLSNSLGGGVEAFDDNDNSGIVRYVSLRHGGATASTANELNGLTMGSVGRGTIIDHVEVVANSDDGFEMFGGTVNLKYCAVQWNDDDAFDWDQGYKGKGQFWFAVKASGRGDNGFEMDSDDNHCMQLPNSHPIVYNATVIGDDTDAGLEAKENTEGEIYNSIFANYQQGLNIYNVVVPDVYQGWNANNFKVQNCSFVSNSQSAFTIQTGSATPAAGADLTKFTTDGNVDAGASIPGFDFTFGLTLTGSALTAVTDVYDAIPNPSLTSTITAPADGFFSPVNYRGAFAATGNWMKTWTYSAFIDASNGLVACPTDINGDGVTNITDFNSVLGSFGTSCD